MKILTRQEWNAIQEQYPYAHKHMYLHFERIGRDQKLIGYPENDRDLYDFFDDNGIYIYPTWFGYNIDDDDQDNFLRVFPMIKGTEDKVARVEVEKSAFMRAFELLNKELGGL